MMAPPAERPTVEPQEGTALHRRERLAARSGGVAAWSVRHPVGVVMIGLAVVVLGAFSAGRLGVDLLPHIIYPEIGVRVTDPGVPAVLMEYDVSRHLEEQLAATEDAIAVQSQTTEGRSAVDLAFPYGTDIDQALRDASSRLDRAKRLLPTTVEPASIFKRDPSQSPVVELVVASPLRDPVMLRTWVDDVFATWFLNLPGVAAVEVGGGLVREIQVLPDQQRLAGLGLTVEDIARAVEAANRDTPGGRLRTRSGELSGRTSGRFASVQELAELPLAAAGPGGANVVRLGEVAEVRDTHEDERLRVRVDGLPGVKVSVQKQPQANTVATVDAVLARLDWLRAQGLVPADVTVATVDEQAHYVRSALDNATDAALSGALLAMIVVYLFLGSLRRTLIIGSVIPIAVLVTFVLMDAAGLTLNIMTLGGLALGIGMLVDNTIVMLENIVRHQATGEPGREAAVNAAREVTSAVVASTSTNLAAVLPFLFIGGLVGLLFRELIFTISAAIAASLVVAVTLVPALAGHGSAGGPGRLRQAVDRVVAGLAHGYGAAVAALLQVAWLVPLAFLGALAWAWPVFQSGQQVFFPDMDEGRIAVNVVGDPGITLEEMDDRVAALEEVLLAQPEVRTVYAQVGGFVFGRSAFESSSRASLSVYLVPADQRAVSSKEWIGRVQALVDTRRLAGVTVRMSSQGIRGIRYSRGDEDLSIRVRGQDLDTLARIGDQVVERLTGMPGLRNVQHSLEELRQELSVEVDRERAAALGLSVEEVGRAVQVALQGRIISDFVDGNHRFDVRLRLPPLEVGTARALEQVLLYPASDGRAPVYLGDLARVRLVPAPVTIRRDQQQRIVEVSANLDAGYALGEVSTRAWERLQGLGLPEGYDLYDGGTLRSLQEGQQTGRILVALAVFLVLVVMAVQYESLRNPLVILASVPFAGVGVAAAVHHLGLPLSMPLWLGLIMLAGIVVNNAILLVEYIELARARGEPRDAAIVQAARLRLRPILMTTLTTVVGMVPLALGLGQGSEMLQPLAIAMVWGLSLATLVTLALIPCLYRITHPAG
jgi:multidrug efflux pump subunit AcrB